MVGYSCSLYCHCTINPKGERSEGKRINQIPVTQRSHYVVGLHWFPSCPEFGTVLYGFWAIRFAFSRPWLLMIFGSGSPICVLKLLIRADIFPLSFRSPQTAFASFPYHFLLEASRIFRLTSRSATSFSFLAAVVLLSVVFHYVFPRAHVLARLARAGYREQFDINYRRLPRLWPSLSRRLRVWRWQPAQRSLISKLFAFVSSTASTTC